MSLAVVDRLRAATETAAGHAGSGPAALAALSTYLEGEPIDQLARSLGLSHSAAVRLVDRLEKSGFVKRRPGVDGRSVSVAMTPPGRRAGRKILDARHRAIAEVLESLSASEQRTLAGVCGKVLGGLTTTTPMLAGSAGSAIPTPAVTTTGDARSPRPRPEEANIRRPSQPIFCLPVAFAPPFSEAPARPASKPGFERFPNMATAYTGRRPEQVPHASSATRILQPLGGSFGAAAMAVILETELGHHAGAEHSGGLQQRFPEVSRPYSDRTHPGAAASSAWLLHKGVSRRSLMPDRGSRTALSVSARCSDGCLAWRGPGDRRCMRLGAGYALERRVVEGEDEVA
jgi:MarR family transcriptional repressor of emrRAB